MDCDYGTKKLYTSVRYTGYPHFDSEQIQVYGLSLAPDTAGTNIHVK